MRSKELLNNIIGEAVVNVADKVLAESPKRSWVESDVTLRSGKCVKFGCRAHIKDIQGVINDLVRIRQRQNNGSVSRQRLSDAIAALRKELRAAQRKYESNNPIPEEGL